jgi:hypothetical protein
MAGMGCGRVRGIGAAGSGPRRCAIAQEEVGQAAPPPVARLPDIPGHPGTALPRLFTLSVHVPRILVSFGPGRSAWRAGGAPLMIVKKILTARHQLPVGYSGQSNRAQMVRLV